MATGPTVTTDHRVADDRHEPTSELPRRPSRTESPLIPRLAIAVSLLPFVVAAFVLIFAVGKSYLPISDHALTEMKVRDIGHHPVLTGLYSRSDWSHPGPMFYYLLAPFYWLSGGASIAISLGALAVNAASIAGIAYIAYRRGGTTLMVWALLGCSLLMRTLSANFIRDPWNNYIVTFPFALLIFLVWAMACRERWALPVGVVVASFVAQTHVGFIALALPLLAFGTVWLFVTERARALKVAGLSLLIAAVLWLPVAIDAIVNHPSNATRIIRYFRHPDAPIHTLGQGWRVVSGQFAATPEWLMGHRQASLFTAESWLLYRAPFPFLLVLVGIAAFGYWRLRKPDGLRLIASVAVAFVLGVIAVDRIIGPVLDYRLRWTWVIGMIGLLAIVWCGLLALGRWQPAVSNRVIPLVGLVGLAVCSAVNVTTAATAGTPQQADVKVVEALMPRVLDTLSHDPNSKHGQVVVEDSPFDVAGYATSIMLQLERRGYDVRMPRPSSFYVGQHREEDNSPVAKHLVVASDNWIQQRDADPTLHQIAKWSSVSEAREHAFDDLSASLARDFAAGRITNFEYFFKLREADPGVVDPAGGWAVAVYLADMPSN